jgi:signal transduction histidine kinase/heme-degrading monooxygenase HmoA
VIVAISQFRVANGMEEAVKQAFRDRPRLVDQAPGFLGMEVLVSAEDASVFSLVTRWTDVESFHTWKSSEAHVQSHRFIPKGLRLDPAYTKLTLLHEIKKTKDSPNRGADRTWSELVNDYVWNSGVVRLLIADLDGTLKACNSGAAELLRAPAQELQGKLLWSYLTDPDAAKLRQWVRSSERTQPESMLLNFVSGDDCVPWTVECTVSVQSGAFVVIGHTAYQRLDALENQLIEINNELTVAVRDRSKLNKELTALGVLAGGIAHDFNNLVSAILANAEIAESSETDGSFPGEEIQNIKAIAMRASGIVRQLMTYAGKKKSDVEPIELSELVDEMMGLIKISIPKSVVVRTVHEENLPAVLGVRPEIQQVVMNLVLNASEALGGKEGMITITTAVGRPSGKAASGSRIDSDGEEYVRLGVSDTGSGISEEAQLRIFDPLFTTKTAGRGLGLAVIQGVVRAHKGVIELITELGHGTTFQIFWPIASKAPDRSSCV